MVWINTQKEIAVLINVKESDISQIRVPYSLPQSVLFPRIKLIIFHFDRACGPYFSESHGPPGLKCVKNEINK